MKVVAVLFISLVTSWLQLIRENLNTGFQVRFTVDGIRYGQAFAVPKPHVRSACQ